MKRTFSFDRRAAIAAAWDFLWADNLRQRAKGDAFRNSTTYYLTASDVENQVRQFAADQREGREWGASGRAYGTPCTWPVIKFPGDLLGDCRDWLRNNRRLTSHNFGRGHVSGARYRPVGEPLAEAEQATIKEKAERSTRVRVVHLGDNGRCACVKRTSWSKSNYRISMTRDGSKVTCPRCVKIVAGLQKEAAGV